MNNDLILRILVNMWNQRQADLAFQFIHDCWVIDDKDWTLARTFKYLLVLIRTLDHAEESLPMRYLLSSNVFK